MSKAEAKQVTKHRFRDAFSGRQEFAMLLLGFASGFPYVIIGGTLNAWLTKTGVNPKEIGILSWVTLAYVFKFMWAAAFQKRTTPFNLKIGPRRFWMSVFLVLVVIGISILAFIRPPDGLATIGLIAFGIAMVSASYDIVQAAWRIESAKSAAELDLLSAIEQFGYRISSIIGGAAALVFAKYFGWQTTFLGAAFVLAAIGGLGLILARPSPQALDEGERVIHHLQQGRHLNETLRRMATGLVMASWAIALFMLVQFMVGALTDPIHHSARDFLRQQSPVVVALTVVVLGVVAAYLVVIDDKRARKGLPPDETVREGVFSILYRAVLEPMMELVSRLRWALIVILPLILTYRFTDAVWGSFAYPFYLGDQFGALGHSLTEVGVASKSIGVGATMLGIAIGGILMPLIGRMPVMLFGALTAALTNLLFADLATGGLFMDRVLDVTHLGSFLTAMHFHGVGIDQKLARLIVAIFGENLAGGIASAASVAFLSSIVNKKYAAPQYALLVSLTFLIGILARPAIGAYIEAQGYAQAFVLCTWLGGFAVFFVCIEWIREKLSNMSKKLI